MMNPGRGHGFMNEPMDDDSQLEGRCLIAMPTIGDPRFERTVIYMCSHSDKGAMGLVVNKSLESITVDDVVERLGLDPGDSGDGIRVHFGGPVETGRGFVLHSDDYVRDGTLQISGGIALTATVDVLKAMIRGDGPRNSLLALGYAGWAPGQLDAEIQNNGWLVCDADPELLFDSDLDGKWTGALTKLGIDPAMLATDVGGSGKPN